MYCDWPALRRCCFCMPLRRGVLVIAYLNVLFCGFMIGVYSYAVNKGIQVGLMYHALPASLPAELSIVVYILEMGFNALLIYGAHKKIKKFVKIYYYFAVSSTLATVLLFALALATIRYMYHILVELFAFGLAGLLIQLYLVILVWSLLNKLEEEGTNLYENQLHQIIDRQTKVESNGVYNPSTIPHNAVLV